MFLMAGVPAAIATGLILPRVANNLGFALPGPHGLPSRLSYRGHYYYNLSSCAYAGWCDDGKGPTCHAPARLQHDGNWPLQRIGVVPTLLDPPRPLLIAQAQPDATVISLFVPW